ncbi:MAG: ATP-binding protein [Firmicutes bacterium]|nr:ATP-binding protein [Bacillota bacterium]
MLFSKKRMVLFVGGYGSGKTEVAVNYALQWRPQVDNLAIVDLDIVNPYFRSRERHELMAAAHIRVVAPAGALATADLPALPPEVGGVLQDPNSFAVLDVGGDPVGARVLGRYSQMLEPGAYDMLFVVNANRPLSQAVAPAVDLIRAIETASRLKVTGLVNNTNLMQYTDLSLLQRGEELALAIGHATGLPLVFNAVAHYLVEEAAAVLRGPILPLQLYMKRPWE